MGLRAGWTFSKGLSVVLIGENLLDRNFRIHGSGVDAPSHNVQMRLRYRF